MKTSRRELLQASAMLGLFGLAPKAFAQKAAGGKTLVVVFLRGGVDGLSMVPPVGDAQYAALRPSLRLLTPGTESPDAALKLDETFGLHPALAPMLPLYQAGQLAVVHAVGQRNASRSHFDAQDYLETGLAGRRGSDGWLNRALVDLPDSGSTFRAVAVQTGLPLSLQGPQSSVAFPSLREFRVGSSGSAAAVGFEQLYAQAVDDALRTRGSEAFASMASLDQQKLADAPPRNGASYPRSPLGKRLADIARLVHAGLGLQVAATEAGGFDTHLAEGAGKGQLALRLADLGQSLAAFATDLGERMKDVCVVTVTEFGRTAKENGTRGTDHGTASAMLVLGGRVNGGRVVSDWPGLQPAQLHEGRDLKVTTDVRSVLGELLEEHLQVASIERAFPGAKAARLSLLKG